MVHKLAYIELSWPEMHLLAQCSCAPVSCMWESHKDLCWLLIEEQNQAVRECYILTNMTRWHPKTRSKKKVNWYDSNVQFEYKRDSINIAIWTKQIRRENQLLVFKQTYRCDTEHWFSHQQLKLLTLPSKVICWL